MAPGISTLTYLLSYLIECVSFVNRRIVQENTVNVATLNAHTGSSEICKKTTLVFFCFLFVIMLIFSLRLTTCNMNFQFSVTLQPMQ